MAQTFEVNATGARFTVVVNHLKSKGSDCLDVGDTDLGDGQGNCSQTRRAAAEALVDWLATDPTGSGDPDFIIMGDLNSYAQEDTIDEIKAGSDDIAGTGDDFTTGDKMLKEAASQHKAPIVPCRTAWNRVRAERPELELHNLPDRSHPGTLGCYLNLCCFYAALSGKPPAGVPTELRIWRPPKTDEAKAEADKLVAAATLNAYQQQLAGWMKRNSVSAKHESIEPAMAEYLQKAAWETWLSTRQASPIRK